MTDKLALAKNGRLFSCGNHSVETTKGVLHFGEPSPEICILNVPTTMTLRDVIQFLNPSMEDIQYTRIVREVNHETSYLVLLTFRTDDAAKNFYNNYDGVPFNSLEENVCKLLYISKIETFSTNPIKSEELPNCAVCLDMMYPEVESIITILCNHPFHVHCLSKWSDTTCPVCRYCQTPENQVDSKCMDCDYDGESLWMCIICGYVACGRYINGHAYDHFTQTQHTYAMQLTDNQVWDYAGDNYVHRLLANKSDGKPVEVEGAEAMRQAEEKVESVQMEYTCLLMQQLESQRKYYEKLIKDCEKSCQKKVQEATTKLDRTSEELADVSERYNQASKERSQLDKKLKTSRTNLTKAQTDLAEEKQMNKCLLSNQEQLQSRIKELEKEIQSGKERITELEEQQRDLMFYLEARDKIDNSVNENVVSRSEMDDSQILVQPAQGTSSSSDGANRASKRNNRRSKRDS